MTDRYQDRPFPADQEQYRAAQQAPQSGESDPLAELARLIGQTDPFANLGRANPVAQPHRSDPPRSNEQYRLPTAAPRPASAADDETQLPPPPSWMQHRRLSESEASPELAYHEQPAFAVPQPVQPYADQDRYDETLYGRIDPAQDPAMAPHDGAYSNDPYDYQDPYGDGGVPPNLKQRRGGMLTVFAVLALAVVGTGAAFGYRTYMGSSRSGEPPVIKADAGPTKVVPAPAAEATGKQIQDRLGGGAGAEKLVSREEQPIDPAVAAPRVVLPQTNQVPNTPPSSAMAPSPKPPVARPNNGTLAGDEPRKIQTFAVRPDRADTAAVPVAPPPARPAVTRTPAPAATRSPPAPVANANASAGNAPLSLSPQAIDTPQAPTRLASAPAAQHTSSGDYLVQISSQRSEADARSSFRTLQGKFPSVLGSRAPLIKRADLGAKGVYYRAMVGPFGSPDEAAQFCGSLKSAGGQCVVQRN